MSLDLAHDLFLGAPKEMSSSEPMADPNEPGHLIGGTHLKDVARTQSRDLADAILSP